MIITRAPSFCPSRALSHAGTTPLSPMENWLGSLGNVDPNGALAFHTCPR